LSFTLRNILINETVPRLVLAICFTSFVLLRKREKVTGFKVGQGNGGTARVKSSMLPGQEVVKSNQGFFLCQFVHSVSQLVNDEAHV